MRSDTVRTGMQQAPHRSLFNALGMTKEELEKVEAIVNEKIAETIPVNTEVMSIEDAKKLIPVSKTFEPDMNAKKVYDKYYEVYKKLYISNKNNYGGKRQCSSIKFIVIHYVLVCCRSVLSVIILYFFSVLSSIKG